MMADDMSAFMGQHAGNQLIRDCLKQSGSDHDERLCVAGCISIGKHIQFQEQIRCLNAELFRYLFEHRMIAGQLILGNSDIGCQILHVHHLFAPAAHESLGDLGKTGDRLEGSHCCPVCLMKKHILIHCHKRIPPYPIVRYHSFSES